MFRRTIVFVISLAALVAYFDGRLVRADFSAGIVASPSGDATFVMARSRYIDAGDAFTCVILDDASVKCFGLGADGQLGSGSTANIGDGVGASVSSSAAIALGSGRSTRAIVTGAAHACALLDDSTVKCWGYGADGALGYGSTTSRGTTSASMGDSLLAVDLGLGRTATAITAGAQHTCALLDDATIKCWGRGASGQLGYGDTQTRGDGPSEMGDSLAAIALGSGRTARAVAAGGNTTCALLDNFTVKCWGDNSSGQLGQGDLVGIGDGAGVSVSVAAAIALGSGRSARAIAVGDLHVCVVLDDGFIKCFGAGGNGRLGSGAADDLGDEVNEMGDSLPVVSLGTGRTAIAITAGGAHTCALLDNYVLKCWGAGTDGKLGYGNQLNVGDNPEQMGDSLLAVNLGTDRSVRAVVAGLAHTCAILDNDTVKCWGSGTNGRRGSGTTLKAGTTAATVGDNLPVVALGVSRTANALTEPGRPTAVTAISGDALATLSWVAPTTTGGSAITDYIVEYSSDSGLSWTIFSDGISSSTSATVTGLTNESTYLFRVSALNVVATGAVSESSSAVTPVAPTTTTTTTTVAPTTTTTTTTVAPTTTTTTTTTTIVAPTTTTTTTTTSTTTPSTTTSTVAPSSTQAPNTTTTTQVLTTTTSTVAPTTTTTSTTTTTPVSGEPVAARVIPILVLQPFAPYVTALTTQQQQRLTKFNLLLRRGDTVTCVGYSGTGPLRMIGALSLKRAESVCGFIAKRVRGITTKVDSHLPSAVSSSAANIQIANQSASKTLAALPTDLSRRVIVVVTPGRDPLHTQ